MKHHISKTLTVLLGAALLFTACDKQNEAPYEIEDARQLRGSWWYLEAVNMPGIISLYEDGNAEYYVGPGCFGESHTSYCHWTLTDNGHQVHFTWEGQSTPSMKWELCKWTPDTLVVKERLRLEDGHYSDAISRTYLRLSAEPAD